MNFKIFFAICIVAIVILAGYTYRQKQNKIVLSVPQSHEVTPEPKIKPSTVCPDSSNIATVIKNSVDSIGEVELYQPDDSAPNKQYSWKLTSKEPFRTYNTDLSYILDYFGQNVQATDQSFKNNALPKILSLGYTQSQVNTRPLEESTITTAIYSRYGFTKDDKRIVINISNKDYQVKNNQSIYLPENSSTIIISCGTSDQIFDDFYDTIIKKSPNYTENTMLNIWNMQDNAVRMDVSSYPGGFGAAEYWIKKGPTWEKIYSGQSTPPCSLFEKYHVGEGLNCEGN